MEQVILTDSFGERIIAIFFPQGICRGCLVEGILTEYLSGVIF
jgi:peroxiredoxin